MSDHGKSRNVSISMDDAMDPNTIRRGLILGAETVRAHLADDPRRMLELIGAASSDERGWGLWYVTLGMLRATTIGMNEDEAAARRWLGEFVDANVDDATLISMAAALSQLHD